MAWTTANSAERDIWNYVSRMESFDYVARAREQFNGSAAECRNTREINAAFSQGRMYFENAKSGDLGVKPLLLYYGAMSLAVGLVLFKNQNKEEGSFRSAHGLKTGDWKRTLHCGLDNVLDLEIKAAPGTFRELADIVWHWNIANVYQNLRKLETYPEVRNLGPVAFARDDSTLTLRDLISRSKYTGGDYADVTGEPSRLHRVIVELAEGNRKIAIRFEHPKPDGVKNDLSFPRDDTSVPLWNNNDKSNDETYMSVVEGFPNRDRLSEFIKLYLISYVLGMLARYFPSKWMSLIRNEAGSLAQPLLAKAVRAIETDFVREFAQQIAVVLNDPYFFGEHLGYLSRRLAHDWRSGWKDGEA